MSARIALYVLLAVVAIAAAALSFFALRDLALLCGFHPRMAPLLPIVVDAGAAAGTLVWLARWAPAPARRFARVLALVLLGSSVAANAIGHGLAAYGLRPHWLVIVAVSAVAPGVLGAVVHLATITARPGEAAGEPIVVHELDEVDAEDVRSTHTLDEHGVSRLWENAPPAGHQPDEPGDDVVPGRATELIRDGAGRRRLARELGVSEHQARALLAAHGRNGVAS